MIFAGFVSDKLFKSRSQRVCAIEMVLVALCLVALHDIQDMHSPVLFLIMLALAGFFLYGPQALLGICAAQHATNRASATANGILGIFGYLSTIVSGFGFGFVAEHYGWNAAYITIFVCAIIGLVTVLTIWGAKATGYTEEDLHEKA